MIDLWKLPKSASFGGKEYTINTDYRDILEIFGILTDENCSNSIRWEIALQLFYDEKIPNEYKSDAINFLKEFLSYGSTEEGNNAKLIDWKIDATVIVGDINKVAGFDVRDADYIHWWTFLAYFNGIGEGPLSTLVSIRAKIQKGKKLEEWEQEYYNEHKAQVDFKSPEDEKEVQDYFDKWL